MMVTPGKMDMSMTAGPADDDTWPNDGTSANDDGSAASYDGSINDDGASNGWWYASKPSYDGTWWLSHHALTP